MSISVTNTNDEVGSQSPKLEDLKRHALIGDKGIRH